MANYVMFPESEERKKLSAALGFLTVYFKGKDFDILLASSKKELVQKARQLKQKKIRVFFQPATEEMLRFALEKAPIDGVIGVENIHRSDSVHYIRGGLDQILCRLAQENEKAIVFSFSSILNSEQRPRLLRRMMVNLELCQKFKVKILFGNFSAAPEEMRSATDLQAFTRILGKSL
ncbi:hypothetical protein HY495_01865 [Candidatus Woesearchaeota archaeon]|nr:hypothetical protein [Candidatus Woesearchaeota archaeon]